MTKFRWDQISFFQSATRTTYYFAVTKYRFCNQQHGRQILRWQNIVFQIRNTNDILFHCDKISFFQSATRTLRQNIVFPISFTDDKFCCDKISFFKSGTLMTKYRWDQISFFQSATRTLRQNIVFPIRSTDDKFCCDKISFFQSVTLQTKFHQ